MNKTVTIDQVNWQAAEPVLRSIRTQVFMDEQHVSAADEWDGLDDTAMHFLAQWQSVAIGTARVLVENPTENHPVFHIGRVAVLQQYRAQGVGRELMRHVIHWCRRESSVATIYLHAQTSRIRFYEHLGFVAQGTEFMDAGIPHRTMWYRPGQ